MSAAAAGSVTGSACPSLAGLALEKPFRMRRGGTAAGRWPSEMRQLNTTPERRTPEAQRARTSNNLLLQGWYILDP